jgi:hypothetical protein
VSTGADMEVENLKKYRVSEKSVFSDDDQKHIQNYKMIIDFLESGFFESIKAKDDDRYVDLVRTCLTCVDSIRNVIKSYELQLNFVRGQNATCDKISEDVDAEAKKKEDDSN